MYLSGTVGHIVECCMHVSQEINIDHPKLDSKTEEADIRIVQHDAHAVANGAKRLVILSAATVILVLSLYYWHQLHFKRLVEMLMRDGRSC